MPIDESLLSSRVLGVDLSGVRRVFELGGKLADPINLSIGKPDFPVDDRIKRAAIEAIEHDRNGYTLTTGTEPLRQKVRAWLERDIGWAADAEGCSAFITSGTSGAILLAFMSLLETGDEVVIPDPYFVMYPHAAKAVGAVPVYCDVYPDFRMTADRIEPLITDRTKMVLLNTPSNPAGVALTSQECKDLRDLCRDRGVVLVSDEIYDEFAYTEARSEPAPDTSLGLRCPSPARQPGSHEDVLLIRGFGKTYGVTGWRLGYAAGPTWLIEQMAKLQQYTFVCPPAPLQAGVEHAFETDVSGFVDEYQKRRDLVVEILGGVADVVTPEGAFYVFVGLPEKCQPADDFAIRLIDENVLVIPGSVFSRRGTHIRLALTAPLDKIEHGARTIRAMIESA
ncbi:MAG: pyridoxal phosphate-dependent aminotransferase [Planctomycetota bacterium]